MKKANNPNLAEMKRAKKSKEMAENPNLAEEMGENPDLLEEILENIFSRLPTKTVGRCRLLSSFWRARLSHPQFINLHSIHKPRQENLILNTADYPLYDKHGTPVVYDHADRSTWTMALPIPDEGMMMLLNLPKNCIEVVGSVHGLVLIADKLGQLFLMNPVTREKATIPNPSFIWSSTKAYGFGYDSNSDDYKIVRVGYGDNFSVAVYSCKRGTWVRKDNFPARFRVALGRSAAFVNGSLHWSCADEDWIGVDNRPHEELAVVAFDLASEEFRLIAAPTDYPYHVEFRYWVLNVFALEGCLCVVGYKWDAWVMKEYGSQNSWTKVTLCGTTHSGGFVKPLCYIGEDQVVGVKLIDKALFLSNMKEGRLKVMLSDKCVVTDACVFVESLLSPKQLAGLV